VTTEPTKPHNDLELTSRRRARRTQPKPLGSSTSTAIATTALLVVPRPAVPLATLAAPDTGLVHLDHAVEPIPVRAVTTDLDFVRAGGTPDGSRSARQRAPPPNAVLGDQVETW
jgi:hypothetical protein